MLTEEQLNNVSNRVYNLDSSRKDFEPDLKVNSLANFDIDNPDIGKYKILKIEDNQENGMQAMAVAPIGADGQPDYSQITITYAGTNFGDNRDRSTDIQMIGFGQTDKMSYRDSNGGIKVVESQAVSALRFAEEIRKQYRNAQITTAGHSLGEALAIYVALKNGWDNMGSHGPDIHNMISSEELAYMRAHPEQFKNYRGNYDYIGGITGNATVTGIHLDYGFDSYTHNLTYWQFDQFQRIIYGNGDVVWGTAKKDIDIDGDGTIDFHVKGIDPKPRDLLSADETWISSGDKIQVNPGILRSLQSNLEKRIVDLSYIQKILKASSKKNHQISESFDKRKEKVTESIKIVFKEAGLASVLFKLQDSVGVIMKNHGVLEEGMTYSELEMYHFNSRQTPILNDGDLNVTVCNTQLATLRYTCDPLVDRVNKEKTWTISSFLSGGTPTLMKSWEIIEEETQTLLKKSDELFEGEGLREGKKDGISESLATVLEVIMRNTDELAHCIFNITELIGGIADNFEQVDSWLGEQLSEGKYSLPFIKGTLPLNYKAYLNRDGIFDDVKDVLQAFDRQVEKRSSEYAKTVSEVYQQSLEKFDTGLRDFLSFKDDLERAVSDITSNFELSIYVKEEQTTYEIVNGKNTEKKTYPVTYWGKLKYLYPYKTRENINQLQTIIIPAISRVENVIWQIRDVKNSLALLEPQLKPIIEEGVYRAFDLDEIEKGQKLVAAIANRLGQELNHVIQVMEAEGMQASAISTLKAKLSQTHQLIRYYVRFVNDCFGDNEFSDYVASSAGPNTEATFTLN
nr:hypothetical protein [uncultured Granulicatella sp.]